MKILLLSSLYPVIDYKTNTTPVVHFFAKEWVKLGHEVKVIHNDNKFLLPLYFIPRSIKNLIEAKLGVRVPDLSQRKPLKYEMDGVKVARIPFLKKIPFGLVSDKGIKVQFQKIIEVCKEDGFVPDYIVGHWEYPQIPLIKLLKSKFKFSKTAIVFHGVNYINKYEKIKELVKDIDYVGFRSMGIKKDFEKLLGEVENSFLCHSGIPDEFIGMQFKPKIFNKNRIKFSFVGLLIQRKFPEIILRSIMKSQIADKFELDIVGEGSVKSIIVDDIKSFKVNENVKLHGKLKRKDVIDLLSNSDCFIMVSKDEAFGLVYLEAMLSGCLVIASKNEGMDGIIIDKFNGFLINSGSEAELTSLLNEIHKMEISELDAISKNAMQTVFELTDSKVAKSYLKNLNILS